MTQTISKTLYDSDLNLWLEDTVAKLKARDFDHIDIDNLVEEIEGLAGRDRRELENRLTTLLEHLLKRCYVDMPREFNGWERTVREQRRQLRLILKQSPSLKSIWATTWAEAFDEALKEVHSDYPQCQFPNTWQFSRDVEVILNEEFWK